MALLRQARVLGPAIAVAVPMNGLDLARYRYLLPDRDTPSVDGRDTSQSIVSNSRFT